MKNSSSVFNHKMIKAIGLLASSWLFFVVLPSFAPVRNLLAAPLLVHDTNAQGDACYILAGGGSIWERLDAGADLILMNRVPKFHVTRISWSGPYSFKAQTSWTGIQWAMDYLAWRGVTSDKIVLLEPVNGFFGTLTEARNIAKILPKNVKKLVVVSSAAHMRRTVLAFRRSLPANIEIIPYAATPYKESFEFYYPLWNEYLKLLVYYFVA